MFFFSFFSFSSIIFKLHIDLSVENSFIVGILLCEQTYYNILQIECEFTFFLLFLLFFFEEMEEGLLIFGSSIEYVKTCMHLCATLTLVMLNKGVFLIKDACILAYNFGMTIGKAKVIFAGG